MSARYLLVAVTLSGRPGGLGVRSTTTPLALCDEAEWQQAVEALRDRADSRLRGANYVWAAPVPASGFVDFADLQQSAEGMVYNLRR